jgi:hypothetical protein
MVVFKDKEKLWYLVGLITADGSLSKDKRHIDITTKDYNFLNEIKKEFGLRNKIGVKNKQGKITYRIQTSNKNFYNFLMKIGLESNKSLRIKSLNIPKRYFVDFLRGVVDRDGEIKKWIHPTNNKQQWCLRIRRVRLSF